MKTNSSPAAPMASNPLSSRLRELTPKRVPQITQHSLQIKIKWFGYLRIAAPNIVQDEIAAKAFSANASAEISKKWNCPAMPTKKAECRLRPPIDAQVILLGPGVKVVTMANEIRATKSIFTEFSKCEVSHGNSHRTHRLTNSDVIVNPSAGSG